ncbi:hypothetical protein JXA12_01565, partial [Candidatus Woesearchaeota archaeon]|nr:hypothetical protein [Candidatus Woesearchaeota archaeon]
GVSDQNGADDIANTTIDNGACTYTTNTTNGDYFNATYTCTGTPYTTEEMNITFCDSNNDCVSSYTSSNTYPNQAPTTPTLQWPTSGNHSIKTRTPTFNWTASTDEEGDDINYTINITNDYAPDYDRDNLTTNNHTTQEELWTEYETYDHAYNWSVRACDNWDCSNYTAVWNFSIDDYLSVTITNQEVNFGTSLSLGSTNDTTNDKPQPFTFRNDGIILANLTNVSATQPLWATVSLGTHYWQYKANNASEPGSFTWADSLTDWQNVTVMQANQTVIASLDYADASDEAAVDVAIEVPWMETGGSKTGRIRFSWRSTKG